MAEENNIFTDAKNNINLYPGGDGNYEEYHNSYNNIHHNSLDRENMNRKKKSFSWVHFGQKYPALEKEIQDEREKFIKDPKHKHELDETRAIHEEKDYSYYSEDVKYNIPITSEEIFTEPKEHVWNKHTRKHNNE